MKLHRGLILLLFPLLSIGLSSRRLAAQDAKLQASGTAGEAADEPQVVIPFDFESKFDEGRYGRMVGEMIWKKLERRGRYVIPESMLDVRAWCQRKGLAPSPTTPPDRMKQIIQDEFGAQIGIWGKVERVAGVDDDKYDFWIRVVDFSVDPPQTVYQVKARTKTVSEIPHVYVKAALDKLYGGGGNVASSIDHAAEIRWEKGPNLVVGDFERGDRAPQGWDPLPKYVRWISEQKATQGGANKLIRFSFPDSVAATSGVLYYSDYFPIEEGATYRFQCRWRTTGSAVKVFIKCYDEIGTDFRRGTRGTRNSKEKREVYRSQQNLKGPAKQWNVQTEDFTPKHTQYTPRWGRVMLYAYYPAGTVDWDDVVVKQIVPAPADLKKDRRLSLETKVRSDEIAPRKKRESK